MGLVHDLQFKRDEGPFAMKKFGDASVRRRCEHKPSRKLPLSASIVSSPQQKNRIVTCA
jgi:hypothetical protein